MWTVLAIGLLAAHLLAMNVAAAGPLAWAWLAGGAGPGDERRTALARRMAWLSIAGLGAGAALGAALLAVPNEPLWAALRRFPASTFWFAGIEILFSAAWTLGLVAASSRVAGRPVLAWLLAVVTASNLLYHFPPLMTVIGKLASDPRWSTLDVIDRPALRELWMRPEVLALWMHVILASFAVTAVAALWPTRRDAHDATDGAIHRRLAAVALATTALQAPVGVWVLVATSPRARDALMGQHFASSGLFIAGIVAAIGLLQCTAHIFLGDHSPTLRRRAGWLAVSIAVLMSGALVMSRRAEAESRRAAQAPAMLSARTSVGVAADR